MADQLERFAKPFPDRFVRKNPSGGGEYVTHSVVNEKLLAVLGPFDYELVEVIRGDVPGSEPNPNAQSARGRAGTPALTGAVVGVVCRLSCSIDGRPTRVEEVGDCEQPHNWPHDGARLKDAMSDALKRCAMRLGCGLHLWSQAEFTLSKQLESRGQGAGSDGKVGPPAVAPAPRGKVMPKEAQAFDLLRDTLGAREV